MISKDEAYKKIASLVERFDEQKAFYKRSEYNETLTRRDFIDPFFKSLGWDIDNEQGYAESYREVIHEDKIKIGGATKAPDYSFRLSGGKRLFFVEAKKPSVLIKDEITPAYQVRRYGWSAKLPISIITDFEEFAIYDCTKKPSLTDKASHGRIKYLTYQNYLNEFDFIWDTFSKEKVLKGSFDKFIQSDKQKKGTATVDYEFLHSLDTWRTYLANNIALRNNIDEDELNFVVQHIIDRIIFLRIAEDRSVEPYGNLQDTIKSGNYYENLLKQFHTADQKYNSGLFDFSKDKVSGSIEIDNKIIKSIIGDLYYPVSPYEFSVISVEILGSAYEQFLGKTISLSKSGRAVIEEKPEVRKAGGVYYTPQYIVDYIVKNTVGKLINGKAPKDINKIKIVDPACGSGSFLIGAYQYLLQYHKDYYTNNGKPSKGSKDNPLTPDGNLTTAEKKRILLNNIFGVDLDANAVEVTKLSLLLKCMEGETEASIATQLKLFHERVLPTLDNNIKSGNSLVQNGFVTPEFEYEVELKKIKPFDWQKRFPDIFKQGGFDCVIGNPPYSAKQSIENKFLVPFYKTVEYKSDLFSFFIERSYEILKKKGRLGFIIPVSWMTNIYYKKLREFLLQSKSLEEINMIDGLVFDTANIDTNIVVLNKEGVSDNKLRWIKSKAGSLNSEFVARDYNQFKSEEGFSISAEAADNWYSLKEKIDKQSVELGKVSKISLGMKLRSNDEFIVFNKSRQNPDPIVFGKDISKYEQIEPSRFFNFSTAVIVGGTKNEKIQKAKTKIFTQAIRNLSLKDRIVATLDDNGYCFVGTVNSVILNDDTYDYSFILGLLNSKLFNAYFKKRFTTISLTASFLGVLPVNKLQTASQKKIAGQLTNTVNQLLSLKQQLKATTLQTKLEQIEGRIDYLEQQINEIVYELYGLTKDEIAIIENA